MLGISLWSAKSPVLISNNKIEIISLNIMPKMLFTEESGLSTNSDIAIVVIFFWGGEGKFALTFCAY